MGQCAPHRSTLTALAHVYAAGLFTVVFANGFVILHMAQSYSSMFSLLLKAFI